VAEKVSWPPDDTTSAVADELISAITAVSDATEALFPKLSFGTMNIVLDWPATAKVMPDPKNTVLEATAGPAVTSTENGLPETETPFSLTEMLYCPAAVTRAPREFDPWALKDIDGSCKIEAEIVEIEQPATERRTRPPFGGVASTDS